MTLRIVNYLAISFAILVLTVTLAPASIWFKVNAVRVSDTYVGDPAPITADREVRRAFSGSYHVLVRGADSSMASCDASSGVFTYDVKVELLNRDMAWWAPSDPRCSNLPEGEYIMETTWTLHNLFWGLVPNKYVKSYSNLFSVKPHPEE